jgi:hypothetical protein
MPSPRTTSLSKSRFCYGLQCLKQLWWRVHDAKAPELVAGPALQAVFDRGHLVGERARDQFPGGTLIGHDYWEVEQKVADTRAALEARSPAIYEASFQEDGVFVAVDVLERGRGGHTIVEVKSSTAVKEQYLPDVAIQLHVARRAGLDVRRGEVMHLNSACRFPELSDLFVRADVTAEAEALLPEIPAQVKRMQRALAGELPVVEVGPHCDEPYECPFKGRCWEPVGADHVSTLYSGRKLRERLLEAGVESLKDVPDDTPLSAPQARQVRAAKTGRVVVEAGLSQALRLLRPPVAYLDFETINPAIPVWKGCGPYMQVPVQLSCHLVGARGATTHHQHLAEGAGDPRPALAEAVVRACAGATTVVAYNASFEKKCLQHLAENVPAQRAALLAVIDRLVDLLPMVRDHVYHPGFGGGFGMKAVAPALVPGLDYADLEIGEGGLASTVLERLLLSGQAMAAAEREALRRHLLAYCERDTLAMVKVVERLRDLAG